MDTILIAAARYVITFIFATYTLLCFTAFRSRGVEGSKRAFRRQRVLIFLLHLLCSLILYMEQQNGKAIVLYVLQLAFLIATTILYQFFYKGLSRLVFNNMLMLLVVSFVILGRISFDYASRQFMIAAVVVFLSIGIPFLIEKLTVLERLGWFYAVFGLLLLLLVFISGVGVEQYGAKNWIMIGGFSFQPSEVARIVFVFFTASLLSGTGGRGGDAVGRAVQGRPKPVKFMQVVKVTAVAAVYVLILVAEKDLGMALIYFVTYLVMLFVATRQPAYFLLGLLAGSSAATLAYRMFDHVRVRVTVWRDPWSVIDDKGYQIAQSLFAIGTGGWFGMGLGKGIPQTIPIVRSDFIFSAIAEELGGLFAICLILVYISCFIMFMNISMKMQNPFYKLTALGLSVSYMFQVFLTIGGAVKFIPLTGITLPLVSYGGSSVMSTILLFSIIQGMYVLNRRELKGAGKEK